jgi:hypothetical protein
LDNFGQSALPHHLSVCFVLFNDAYSMLNRSMIVNDELEITHMRKLTIMIYFNIPS